MMASVPMSLSVELMRKHETELSGLKSFATQGDEDQM